MDHWTEDHMLFVYDSYIRNNEKIAAVQREFGRHFNILGIGLVPSSVTILEFVNIVRTGGSLFNQTTPAVPDDDDAAVRTPAGTPEPTDLWNSEPSPKRHLSERHFNNQKNCQICQSGENKDLLLICRGCDKGYHTYCSEQKIEHIHDGDWFCHQCSNKANNEESCCIVCGKNVGQNLLVCEYCPTALHTYCIPFAKVPQGKWSCSNCSSKKEPKRKRARRSQTQTILSPLKTNEITNSTSNLSRVPEKESIQEQGEPVKRFNKAPCRQILDDLECHEEAWPFLVPVNTKQYPMYRKIITNPMDLQTISRRLTYNKYKSRDEFVSDVRLIFDNCEIFNQDDSPVGKAGRALRLFFETKWAELSNLYV